ncbi:MAG: hypothetical protein V7K69_30115 [Nostoc sp.]
MAVPIVEVEHLAPALSVGMDFLKSKVSLDAFCLSVAESLAQSKLSFFLNKNPECLQEAEIIFHCFSFIVRILKGKQ